MTNSSHSGFSKTADYESTTGMAAEAAAVKKLSSMLSPLSVARLLLIGIRQPSKVAP